MLLRELCGVASFTCVSGSLKAGNCVVFVHNSTAPCSSRKSGNGFSWQSRRFVPRPCQGVWDLSPLEFTGLPRQQAARHPEQSMPKPIPRVEPRRDRLKHCSGPCNDWLPIECFDLDRTRADGRRSVCKACRQERQAELAAGAPRRRPWSSCRPVSAVAREAGLARSTLAGRLAAGWSLPEALSRPVAPSGRNGVRLEVLKGPRRRRGSRAKSHRLR